MLTFPAKRGISLKTLKTETSDSMKDWFAVGEYKHFPNEVGGEPTTAPKLVSSELRQLITDYEQKDSKTLEDIVEFHARFEKIHPFQDGNGRVGRLIMFKECLRNNVVPFVIDESIKLLYYNGLKNWERAPLLSPAENDPLTTVRIRKATPVPKVEMWLVVLYLLL